MMTPLKHSLPPAYPDENSSNPADLPTIDLAKLFAATAGAHPNGDTDWKVMSIKINDSLTQALWKDTASGRAPFTRILPMLVNLTNQGKPAIEALFAKGANVGVKQPRVARMIQLLDEIYSKPGENRLGVSWLAGTDAGTDTAWSVDQQQQKRALTAAQWSAMRATASTVPGMLAVMEREYTLAPPPVVTPVAATGNKDQQTGNKDQLQEAYAKMTDAQKQAFAASVGLNLAPGGAGGKRTTKSPGSTRLGNTSSSQSSSDAAGQPRQPHEKDGRLTYGPCYRGLECERYSDIEHTGKQCAECGCPTHVVCTSSEDRARCEMCVHSDLQQKEVPLGGRTMANLNTSLGNIRTGVADISTSTSANVDALRAVTSTLDSRLHQEQTGQPAASGVADRARAANTAAFQQNGDVNDAGLVVGDRTELVVAQDRLPPQAHEALVLRSLIAMNFYKVYTGVSLSKQVHIMGNELQVLDEHSGKQLPWEANLQVLRQWGGSMKEWNPVISTYVDRFINHIEAQRALYGPVPAMQYERALRRKCQTVYLECGKMTTLEFDRDLWNAAFAGKPVVLCQICGATDHTPEEHHNVVKRKTRGGGDGGGGRKQTRDVDSGKPKGADKGAGKGAGAGAGKDEGKGTGGRGSGAGDAQKMSDKVCPYFNKAQGCKKGDTCNMKHVCSVDGCGSADHGAAGHT